MIHKCEALIKGIFSTCFKSTVFMSEWRHEVFCSVTGFSLLWVWSANIKLPLPQALGK